MISPSIANAPKYDGFTRELTNFLQIELLTLTRKSKKCFLFLNTI